MQPKCGVEKVTSQQYKIIISLIAYATSNAIGQTTIRIAGK